MTKHNNNTNKKNKYQKIPETENDKNVLKTQLATASCKHKHVFFLVKFQNTQ